MRTIMILTLIMAGCGTVQRNTDLRLSGQDEMELSRLYLASGEYYLARRSAQGLLEKNPNDAEVQKLMADILNLEIARQKSAFEDPKSPEELNAREAGAEVRTWLDRSEAYLKLGQYDKAEEAAQKVFYYEPDSASASQMIDKIRETALGDSNYQSRVSGAIARDEIQERVYRYRQQAKDYIASGKWGSAKHVIHKILLLAPEDPEGLELQRMFLLNQSRKIA